MGGFSYEDSGFTCTGKHLSEWSRNRQKRCIESDGGSDGKKRKGI